MMAPATLTAEQARAITDEVKGDARALWSKLLGLYESGAHSALGYSSWANYCAVEFDMSDASAYRLLGAARIVAQLPIGSPLPTTESQARELARLPDPEARAEVWADVQAAATPEAPVTAATVREAVTRHPSAPPPKPAPVRAVTDPAADFPEDDGEARWQCAGCNRWYGDDVNDCPECQPALWSDEVIAAPTPTVVAPEPEPFVLPPASLTEEQKAFYKLAGCVRLMDFDPVLVADAPDAIDLGPSVGQFASLTEWLQRVVTALRARQVRPDLRAVK